VKHTVKVLQESEMSHQPVSVTLLNQVQSRLRAASFARALHWWTLGAFGLACATVLAVRLMGLLPENRQPLAWLLVFPAVAASAAWLFHRRVEKTAAARAVDQHAKTDDLFLTLATLSSSAGEYQPLVEQSAAKVATRIVPAHVVPYKVERPIGMQAGVLCILALLVWLLPTLDPFGNVEAATKVEKAKKEIELVRKAVKSREEKLSQEVKTAQERDDKLNEQMTELMASLRQMRPTEKKPNSKVLQDHRGSLNDMWKNVSSEELREMLSQSISDQQFGGQRTQKMNEWLKQLQQGNSDMLQQQMDSAKETMEAMLEAKTPEDRQKLASQLRRQLQDMKKFSSEKASSPELENALNQALKALEALAAKKQSGEATSEEEMQMAQEAAEALRESLELSKTELQELARSAKEMKQLEEALQTLQQAEKLNSEGQLDGEQCEGCKSLAEYTEKYRKMMAGMGKGGEGEREKGGSPMDEDDSDPEGYKDEKTKTQIQAGKVLLSIKTKEAATEKDFDPEELKKYESTVSEIKSGVQAAIENEQIPPGYVDGIKSYFDNLDSADSTKE
jgi:tetratricopeptide (TPR) repeat protein